MLRIALILVWMFCLPALSRAQFVFPDGPVREDTGARTYATLCASCHGADGRGVPGEFPPLAGLTPDLLASQDGRQYLARVMLWGLEGATTIAGQTYERPMPPWNALEDAELAGVLNFILRSWGNSALLPEKFETYAPADIAALRKPRFFAFEMRVRRDPALEAPRAPAQDAQPALAAPVPSQDDAATTVTLQPGAGDP